MFYLCVTFLFVFKSNLIIILWTACLFLSFVVKHFVFHFIHSLSITASESQLTLSEGRVHPRQIATSSQDWHLEAKNQKPKQKTFTPTSNLESPVYLHVFRLWEEAGVHRGNSCRHGENMQTPHRKTLPQLVSNQEPSCCEAEVLTTAPWCNTMHYK